MIVTANSALADLRESFHRALGNTVWFLDPKGIPTNADKDAKTAVRFAKAMLAKVGMERTAKRPSPQQLGKVFEEQVADFVEKSFRLFANLRPGEWFVETVGSRAGLSVARFQQYRHLKDLAKLAEDIPDLAATLGNSYLISPDVVVYRSPVPDAVINSDAWLVDSAVAMRTGIRSANCSDPILHANISCKWTLRSDRAQNARSESLSLIRNRKGSIPHIAVVTAEPSPSRIASLALGTGDIDCVYHIALPELEEAVHAVGNDEALAVLKTMLSGARLRDISDLPLDITV